MGISEKVVRRLLFRHLSKNGFDSYMISYYGNHVLNDIFRNEEDIPFKKRMWALKRGFCVDKIKIYNLTEDNYRNYLSDYDYYRIFPLNNRYAMWINDKLTMKYTLNKFDEFLPEYYANIDIKGNIMYLMDYPKQITKNAEGIIEILKEKGHLAVKKVAGAASEGFYEFAYSENQYYVNNEPYTFQELEKFILNLRGYLITEFIIQHSLYRKIWNGSVHTLRVQTVKEKGKEPECLFSFIRLGSKKILNAIGSADLGVTANVDRETGEIKSGFLKNENGEWEECTVHPDTKVEIVGRIPHWEYILEKCIEMHEYMGELEYLGFDVIVTDDGFKICEVNSHSGIRAVQRYMPFLQDVKCREYFKKYL